MDFLSALITDDLLAEIRRAADLRAKAAQESIVKNALVKQARKTTDAALAIEKNLKRKQEGDVEEVVATFDAAFAAAEEDERFDEINARLFLHPKSYKMCAFICARGLRCKCIRDCHPVPGMTSHVDPDVELRYCGRHERELRSEPEKKGYQLEILDRIFFLVEDLSQDLVHPVQRALHDLPPRALPNNANANADTDADELLRELGVNPSASASASADEQSGMDIDS